MNRRNLLTLGIASGATGAAGLGLGYRYHGALRHIQDELLGREKKPPAKTPRAKFQEQSRAIKERHRRQTKQDVQTLKTKYEGAVLGKFRVWDLIEKLALCVDPTDELLRCTSQYMHVCQVIAGMERDGELDDAMLLTALLHDLGKVAMLAGEAPENVVCFIEPVEALEPASGLDKVVFQFGHDEIAYSRLKDHVPEHIAWLIRYHSMIVGKAEEYMSPKDREYYRKYFTKFSQYDHGTKSTAFLPRHVTLQRYRDFVETHFPQPILF